ncbi:MAG: alpha/beta fold hydrolase [Phycisphaerae bacterium]|jgi:O-glycosyl hydrolase/pimeloyl-ACP methyl ester carboxylesterase
MSTKLFFSIVIFTAFSSCFADTNVLTNPSLEDTRGWASRGGVFTQSTVEKHSGSACGKSSDRTANWQGIKQSLMGKVKNESTYQVSGWIKLENAASANVAISLEQHDANGTVYTNIATGTANNSGWVELKGTFTLKVNGALTYLDIYFEGPPSGTNFFVDDVNVFGPAPEALDNASIKPNAYGTIDANIRYQKLEGFGASAAWYDRTLAGFSVLPNFYNIAFKELGLDILRIRNTYLYDGHDSNYTDRAVKIIDNANKVLPRPLKIMIASWSPPSSLKSNNNTKGGTLAKDANGNYKYEALAQWWYDSLVDLNSRGVYPYYLTFQNEPDYLTEWDTCRFDPCQTESSAGYNLAFRAVYNKLGKLANPPRFLGPECKNTASARMFINNFTAEDKSKIFGYSHHIYNDGSDDAPDSFLPAMSRFAADFNDKPLMQNEFARESGGGDVTSFADAMNLALIIHNALTAENVSAFLYWQLIWEKPLGLISTHRETYSVNPVYYAFKHYSAFTDPNWQRIDAKSNSNALRISAFLNPASDKISAIIINPSQIDITLELAFDNFDVKDSNIYRTTEKENCAAAGKLSKLNDFVSPKNSITTVVLSGQKKMTKSAKARLNEMRTMLPVSQTWDQWLDESGVTPPDFDNMPSQPDLPQIPKIKNAADWQNMRKDYLALYHKYVFGSMPAAPTNLKAEILNTREANDLTIENVLISFGTENKAKLNVEIIRPAGKGPFPVLLTQPFHKRWAMAAVARGYVACIYNGDDFKDDTKSYPAIWPDCDWSALTRRALAAARSVDYLYTLDFIDKNKIAIIGHSRNGKQTFIAGAIDERITAIIPVSSGQGGACPSRYYNESYFGESIEMITRSFPDWFCNNFRFFSGRENKLPVESNILMALMAPRPMLICEAANDGCSSIWGVYQSYFSAKEVYKTLGRPDKIAIALRQGGHGVGPEFIGQTLDWLDWQFDRLPADKIEQVSRIYDTKPPYPQIINNKIIDITAFPKAVDKLTTDSNQWRQQKAEIIEQINLMLGTASNTTVDESMRARINQTWKFTSDFVGRDRFAKDQNYAGIEKIDFLIEGYIPAHIYKPLGRGKFPACVWLSPACVPFGYSSNYSYGVPVHLKLAKKGFAVLAFDPIGFGSRQIEAVDFYDRNKDFSLLGKMVFDVQRAIDSLSDVNYIDSKKIYLLGYALGSQVALYTAALDERAAGVVCVAGLSPMRLESPDTGGIQKYCTRYPYIPKLESFIRNEARVPYDIDQLIASVAPRKALIVACTNDYETNISGLKNCIENAAQVYNLYDSRDKLQFDIINEYNYFSIQIQNLVYGWLENNVK